MTGAGPWAASTPQTATTRRASAALVVAAFLFGSTFLVVQDAIREAPVMSFLAVRFLLGGALLWPFARRRPATQHEFLHGALAGVCLLTGFVLQTFGLRYTTSSSSAFITYLLVVFVPLVTAVVERSRPERPVVGGAVMAVVGLFLLSGGMHGFGGGELLTLGCSAAFGLHIVVLGHTAASHDPLRLTCWQLFTVGLASVVPGWVTGGYRFGAAAWLAVAFCGLAATAVAFSCMVWAQRYVTEARAALVLVLEPVFAAVLGYLSGERLGVGGAAGALLILIAVMVTELSPRRPPAARSA